MTFGKTVTSSFIPPLDASLSVIQIKVSSDLDALDKCGGVL